jgi:alkylhydroperoxidase/carboxymuconolactone decarboxylase family protein YurZ
MEDKEMAPKNKQAIMEKMHEVHGEVLVEHEFLIKNDWGWLRRRQALYEYHVTRESALPRKMKEIIFAVANAVRMPRTETARYIKKHIRAGLKAGATPREFIEAFECTIHPTGEGTVLVGINCLREVLEEDGIPVDSNEGARLAAEEEQTEPVHTDRKTLEDNQLQIHGYVLPEHKYIMDHNWDWVIRSHDFFNYNVMREGALPRKMRSIVVVSALCVRIPGIEGEKYIRNHMGQAMKAGATEAEIFDALQTAQFPCGGPTMLVGIKSLMAVVKELKEKEGSA